MHDRVEIQESRLPEHQAAHGALPLLAALVLPGVLLLLHASATKHLDASIVGTAVQARPCGHLISDLWREETFSR